MLSKRNGQGQAATASVRKELEHLYSRRTAVDSLIRSLERYGQSKVKAQPTLRKSA